MSVREGATWSANRVVDVLWITRAARPIHGYRLSGCGSAELSWDAFGVTDTGEDKSGMMPKKNPGGGTSGGMGAGAFPGVMINRQ